MNERISINPNVCHGKPVIANTRVLVSNILTDLADGKTIDEILVDYPSIRGDDVRAALQFGSELAGFETYERQRHSSTQL